MDWGRLLQGVAALDAGLVGPDRSAWERECRETLARLESDPRALADFERESQLLGNAAAELAD